MTRTTYTLALVLTLATCAAGRAPDNAHDAGKAPDVAVARAAAHASTARMARIPAGSYMPLFADGGKRTNVHAFRLDIYPVTRAEYAAFVARHAEWKKSVVRTPGYLSGWTGDVVYGDEEDGRRPVTSVTRAAAAAYCAAQGKRLPTLDEWEYSAGASRTRREGSADPSFRQMILSLYTRARPSQPPLTGSGFMNVFGVGDMHGVVWEWVAEEHHMNMVMPDGRPHDLTCVGSANGASDPTSFAAFLRYAYRSGLNSSSTGTNLGFRCAGAV
jgi:formylglycine-generating enzyme required for sulfatase activity